MKGSGKTKEKPITLKPEVKSFLADFYERYNPFIRKTVRSFADDPEMVDELFSEVCFRMLRHGEKLIDMEDWKRERYIVTTVRNCSYRCLRRKKTERERHLPWDELMVDEHSPQQSAEEDAISREDIRQIRAAVSELPPRERDVLALKYWTGMDFREIASVLGVSDESIHTYTGRALKRLKEILYGKD
ncbi:MAG: sigma-70 family RNA polymerase sigma factor [Clostridia bacterium]|nr:sigma-70 family RNA polymerase sigma factor [Clostridia bacterium]